MSDTARPDRHRRPPARAARRSATMSRSLALALVVLALLGGLVVGYLAHGDDPPAGLITESRDLPVVTVTVAR
ncbi:MAG TPA: hypothetical protein PKE32_00160 [Miltoncostaeaceae bacterium]|nr:hypothetical protein [Miltoncostaeaceae bacterium]